MMKIPDNNWLFLEPYVNAIVKSDQGLLYNTVSRKYVVIPLKGPVKNIFEHLCRPEHSYVVALPRNLAATPDIISFIHLLRRNFFGDCIPAQQHEIKPFNHFPQPVVKIKRGTALKDFLREISFYSAIPASPDHDVFNEAYRQFHFPIISPNGSIIPAPELIETVLDQLKPLKSAPSISLE